MQDGHACGSAVHTGSYEGNRRFKSPCVQITRADIDLLFSEVLLYFYKYPFGSYTNPAYAEAELADCNGSYTRYQSQWPASTGGPTNVEHVLDDAEKVSSYFRSQKNITMAA